MDALVHEISYEFSYWALIGFQEVDHLAYALPTNRQLVPLPAGHSYMRHYSGGGGWAMGLLVHRVVTVCFRFPPLL